MATNPQTSDSSTTGERARFELRFEASGSVERGTASDADEAQRLAVQRELEQRQ